MKSFLYNLGGFTDEVYKSFYNEYSEFSFVLPFFLRGCNTNATIRLDTGNYLFCANDSFRHYKHPIIHLIACVEDATKLDDLVAIVGNRHYSDPHWERFEINDDAIFAENIQALDSLSLRKMIIQFDASKGVVSFDGYDNVKALTKKGPHQIR